jgi:putative flippase GtrA
MAMRTRSRAVPAIGARVGHGLRRGRNWMALMRFCAVGASGYVVNLAVFAFSLTVLGVHHLVAATMAFLVAVMSNFWLNRRWTFRASNGDASSQAARFLAVSVVAFLFAAGVLELLVAVAGVRPLVAQALAVAAGAPLSFAANKLWTFDR